MNPEPRFIPLTLSSVGYHILVKVDTIIQVQTRFYMDHEGAKLITLVNGVESFIDVVEDVPEVFRRLNGDFPKWDPAYTRPKFLGQAAPNLEGRNP